MSNYRYAWSYVEQQTASEHAAWCYPSVSQDQQIEYSFRRWLEECRSSPQSTARLFLQRYAGMGYTTCVRITVNVNVLVEVCDDQERIFVAIPLLSRALTTMLAVHDADLAVGWVSMGSGCYAIDVLSPSALKRYRN